MRPMKPYKGGLEDLKFPKLVSPKLDGIRCLKIGGVARTAAMKRIPNYYIRTAIESISIPDGLDGELVLRDRGATFQETVSAIMSREGRPDFIWYVFDTMMADAPFVSRYAQVRDDLSPAPAFAAVLHHDYVNSLDAAERMLDTYLDSGFEGAVFREPDAHYKFGRSTCREQGMFAIKPFVDSDAVVLSVEEAMHNSNPSHGSGLIDRTMRKGGTIGLGMMGALTVRDIHTGVVFSIGTGFTAVERRRIWDSPEDYMGRICKYKYMKKGTLEKPRHPVFMGWRPTEDITTEQTNKQTNIINV